MSEGREPNTPPRGVQRALAAALDKAIGIHRPAVAAHVRRIRERHPKASPGDVIALLEKWYLAAVIGTGAAAGGVAAAPGVGTAAAVALSGGEMVGFLEASALFTLAVAEVHGLRIDDLERRRTLVLTVLLGNVGASFIDTHFRSVPAADRLSLGCRGGDPLTPLELYPEYARFFPTWTPPAPPPGRAQLCDIVKDYLLDRIMHARTAAGWTLRSQSLRRPQRVGAFSTDHYDQYTDAYFTSTTYDYDTPDNTFYLFWERRP